MRQFVIWCAGFVALFAFNLLVEAFLLPALNLENTPRNDLYFIGWWVAVGLWLGLGNELIRLCRSKFSTPQATD